MDATASWQDGPAIPAEQLVVNVKIISPSMTAPLSLTALSAPTTIQQLKEKIRSQLPSRMSEATQRLIYRGRMLNRDDDTLLDVFGEELIRSSEQPAVHLILSEHADSSTAPSSTGTIRGQSPARVPPLDPTQHRERAMHAHQFFNSVLQQGARHSSRRTPVPPGTQTGSSHLPGQTSHGTQAGTGVPSQGHHQPQPPQPQTHQPQASPFQIHRGQTYQAPLGPQQIAQQLAQIQRLNQLNHLTQRETLNRAYLNQQRDRAGAGAGAGAGVAMGMPGMRYPAAQPPGVTTPGVTTPGVMTPGVTTPDGSQRRASPAPHPHQETQTHVEALPSGGSRIRITTTETYTTTHVPGTTTGQLGQQGLTDAQVQNMLRTADTREAILTMTNAMQRSASGASMGPQSGRATPNTNSRTPSGGTSSAFTNLSLPNSNSNAPGVPEVYILNSPQGPRALLINQNSETYYTPAGRALARNPMAPTPTTVLPNPNLFHSLLSPQPYQPYMPGQAQATTAPRDGQQEQGQGGAEGQNLRRRRVQVQQQGRRGVQAVAIRANNNDAGLAGRVARIWPHFWLGLRLAIFVWWFTTPHSTWSRWFTVFAIAAAIFVLNTGMLDGYAEQIWRIICRHMENLIPMAEPNQMRNANIPVPPAPRAPEENGNQTPPGPADAARAAARIPEQRRQANPNWLMDGVRRLERAGLLFLASIAPGVAERHIAHLEAEVERQRREAEAAAEAARRAAEEAEAATAAAESGEGEGQADRDSQDNSPGGGPSGAGAESHTQDAAAPAAPELIPV